MLVARGMLSYRAVKGYSWDVISAGKACSGSACVGEFVTGVNCFFRVMSVLLLRLRPLWRVRVTGLYSAFGNLLRCNCYQETHNGQVVSFLTHALVAVIGRHFYLIRVYVYVTKLISKLCLLKNPLFFGWDIPIVSLKYCQLYILPC